MSEEEIKQEGKKRAEKRKARGNNGAKRNMHFEMETIEKDLYPDGIAAAVPFSSRDAIRYKMIRPMFA